MAVLEVKLTGSANKYFESLDRATKKRISDKLDAIAKSPSDPRLSKPLTEYSKRAARVGDYRIIFEFDEKYLYVDDIGPRGQVYRRLGRR